VGIAVCGSSRSTLSTLLAEELDDRRDERDEVDMLGEKLSSIKPDGDRKRFKRNMKGP
jgi:hypothetical protein